MGHDETSWDRASQIRDELTTKEGLAYDNFPSITVARPLRNLTGFFVSSSTAVFERIRALWQCQGAEADSGRLILS
jgi:hypothetical protein